MAYTVVFAPEAEDAFAVEDAARKVSIIGVFYGGRDYETALGFGTED